MKTDYLIIGAGFAGASTAFHLSRLTEESILLLEREEIPGYHASGRNASLVLQSVAHPEVRKIVSQSVQAYREHADEVGFEEVGSLLLGSREDLEPLRAPALVDSDYLTPEEARRRVPLLEGHEFELALHTRSDGVMDISRLLQFYLTGAQQRGVETRFESGVHAISSERDHFTVTTGEGAIEARFLVDAAGAWAPEIAEMAGLVPLQMTSFKRHLFVLEGMEPLHEDWPFVWSIAENFYFRPESGGLLFSICDEEAAQGSFVQTVNPDRSEELAELIGESLPALEDASQRRVWSCFRTKTPHGGFYLEPASDHDRFYWVAGLGGHGMGASWEIGRRAATEIVACRTRLTRTAP